MRISLCFHPTFFFFFDIFSSCFLKKWVMGPSWKYCLKLREHAGDIFKVTGIFSAPTRRRPIPVASASVEFVVNLDKVLSFYSRSPPFPPPLLHYSISPLTLPVSSLLPLFPYTYSLSTRFFISCITILFYEVTTQYFVIQNRDVNIEYSMENELLVHK